MDLRSDTREPGAVHDARFKSARCGSLDLLGRTSSRLSPDFANSLTDAFQRRATQPQSKVLVVAVERPHQVRLLLPDVEMLVRLEPCRHFADKPFACSDARLPLDVDWPAAGLPQVVG